MTDEQIFHRCYSQMTRLYLPPGDERLNFLRKGKVSGPELCMKLLDEAQLTNRLMIKNGSIRDDEIAAIVRTFNTLHISWFHSYNYITDFNELLTSLLYDFSEVGTPFTLALLAPNWPFKKVLVNDKSYSAIRSKAKLTFTLDHHEKGEYFEINYSRPWRTGGEKGAFYKPDFVEFGTLRGFKPDPPNKYVSDSFKGKPLRVAPGQNLGTGGVAGSTAYLILNSGTDRAVIPDDGLYVHRSWSKALMKDLLCRELPMLREEDVKNDILPAAKFEFQKNTQCLTCHSTIDTMARVTGDRVILSLYDEKEGEPPNRAMHVAQMIPERSAKGSVKFRSYNDVLIDRRAGSLKELSKVLSETDDFYICAAKRYFDFFTGINVQLVSSSPLSERLQNPYYKFVVEEGLKLKNHQSSRQLVKNILNSPFYSVKDYGVSRE